MCRKYVDYKEAIDWIYSAYLLKYTWVSDALCLFTQIEYIKK